MKKLVLLFACCSLLSAANAQNDPGPNPGDVGSVTFVYAGATVTYATVRGADGMIWLQQNMGASQVATSSTDPLSYGDYFQWGRWDDGHQLSTSPTAAASTITPNDPSGISAGNPNFLTGNNPADWWSGGGSNDTWIDAPPSSVNGTDPCAAIGPGWHLPTQPEFANAITMEGITDAPSAFSSYLALPVAGQREPVNGTMQNVGTYGQYWTASPSTLYAKAVSIQPTAINANDDAYRSYGSTLRCLTTCTGVFAPDTINGDDTVCMESTNTYTVPAVNNADSYTWTVPTGWTIIGPNNGSSISVMAGSTGGTITAMAVNTCGNSATTSLDVFVNPLPVPVITQSGAVLNTGSFVSYQWLLGGNPITGATNNSYTTTTGGSYQVIVTDANGCSDTSAVHIVSSSVGTITGPDDIHVYPNPATSVVNIDAPVAVNIAIYGIDGRKVIDQQNATRVDISRLAAGTYQMKLTDKDGNAISTEKLVVLPH